MTPSISDAVGAVARATADLHDAYRRVDDARRNLDAALAFAREVAKASRSQRRRGSR
jgi:hypothetical protein